MAKNKRKADAKLEKRIQGYEESMKSPALSDSRKRGYVRPGSLARRP